MSDQSAPISILCKSATTPSVAKTTLNNASQNSQKLAQGLSNLTKNGASIKTFDSYAFERNLLNPGAPFRLTAPGIDKSLRLSIRSGDTIQLFITNRAGTQIPIGTGFIDETDCHITPNRVEYVITGRDTLGQLIDNAAVDKNNKIIAIADLPLSQIFTTLIANTRIPQQPIFQQADSGTMLFQTNVGETKMNALQRYMEYTNTLLWTLPNGQAVIGKPNFVQASSGIITVDQNASNVLDCRVKRNINNAIRMIVNQMQNGDLIDPSSYTVMNSDADVQKGIPSGVGRSVYRVFSFSEGFNSVNFFTQVANIPTPVNTLGAAYSYREIARENVQVLDVEMTFQGHLNSNGVVYDIDQVYTCNIPDENVSEDLYCYAVTHELTLDHGMITKLKLCKLGTIVASAYKVPKK
jgi:prophage tail gpP-like protein